MYAKCHAISSSPKLSVSSLSITYGNMDKNVFYFFYKITRVENLNVEIVFFIKA